MKSSSAPPFHTLSTEEAVRALASDAQRGLPVDEANQRLLRNGPNTLPDREGRSVFSIAFDQVRSAMTLILVVAAIVSISLGNISDAAVIAAIVVLNLVLGFAQDFRAERAMASLRDLSAPHARVRRDGKVEEISASHLVAGDIVLLQAGDRIAADGRVLTTDGLATQEAALTGESASCAKQSNALAVSDLAVGDRTNMCFRGTLVARGRGVMLVTATGLATEVGHVASLLHEVSRSATPLQKRLAQFGRVLAASSLVLVALVILLGLLGDATFVELVIAGLSLAVAAVPEGLPTVATVALALGARRMLHRNTLVRKLPAVETMGAVTVICSDKTGTLTQNKMVVASVMLSDLQPLTLANVDSTQNADLSRLLICNVLCNDAKGELENAADPTEQALLGAARKLQISPEIAETHLPRIASMPFDSQRMRMTTVHTMSTECCVEPASGTSIEFGSLFFNSARFACIKGSMESVLDCCDRAIETGTPTPLDDEKRRLIQAAGNALASRGMRVLASAVRLIESDKDLPSQEEVESHACFLGLVAMEDPIRPEAKSAIEECKRAGIRAVMITGDHPHTARAIASDLGLVLTSNSVMTGLEIDQLDDEGLEQAAEHVNVYARVTPSHKLRIVSALQNRGEVVAMTGDGVNDAPALKRADIGIAMGKMGTDVAREAADTVLLDDDFATIVRAVEDGRTIYSNVRKFLRYTMTSNAGEIATMLIGTVLLSNLPLLPLQILWINLVTDGLPGLALAMEPIEAGTMTRPPRAPSEPLVSRQLAWEIAWVGLLMATVSLGIAYVISPPNDNRFHTVVFTVLSLSQLGNALAVRSDRQSLWTLGLSSNRFITWAIIGSVIVQVGLLYVGPLSSSFHVVALSVGELLTCLAASSVVFVALELRKLWLRRKDNHHAKQTS